jgi:hypothetical protein
MPVRYPIQGLNAFVCPVSCGGGAAALSDCYTSVASESKRISSIHLRLREKLMKRKGPQVGLTRAVLIRQISVYLIVLLGVLVQVTTRGATAHGFLDRKITVDIPENTSLEDALIRWGSAARLSVLINTADVQHQSIKGVKGVLSAREALEAILSGSGLRYTTDGDRIMVMPVSRSTQSLRGAFEATSDARILWWSDYDVNREKRLAALGGDAAVGEPVALGVRPRIAL